MVNISNAKDSGSRLEWGQAMHALATELFPLCRSITGNGLRATLHRLQQEIPLTLHEVPSGTAVLDWIVPDEWNVRSAWIADGSGKHVVDFANSNLHLVGYSEPVRARMNLGELRPRLHTLPEHPAWIPYRTSYYKRNWGFCLPHDQFTRLRDADYDVFIDSTLEPGALSYGELLVRGEIDAEVLISSHCCHPSLANDNLSGIVVAAALARQLIEGPRRQLSYRFLFAPGTIGAIAWLARNETSIPRIRHGLVLTCLGDRGAFTYKRSRQGNAVIDTVAEQVLSASGSAHHLIDFSPYGYDERQFCSPGFNLPVGCLMRSQHGTFPEYHTSADNLHFIRSECLGESLDMLLALVNEIERGSERPREPRGKVVKEAGQRLALPTHSGSRRYVNLKPKGEPQLGRYGFYEAVGPDVLPALWVLNLSDGACSIADIATRSMLPFDILEKAADVLAKLGLIKEARDSA